MTKIDHYLFGVDYFGREKSLKKNYGDKPMPLTRLSHASTIGFCLCSSSVK
jgi:hypothetical protein